MMGDQRLYMNGSWHPHLRIPTKAPSRTNWLLLAGSLVATVALVTSVIAFATASWLVNDPFSIQPVFGLPFDRLGLWQICFRIYSGRGGMAGYGLSGLGGLGGLGGLATYSSICHWFLNSAWEPMHDFASPVFFTVTQGLYALGLLASLIAIILLLVALFRPKTFRMLYFIGATFLLSCTFISGAIVVFGSFVYNDAQWGNMFQGAVAGVTSYQLSWSFAAAVAGALLLFITAILFLVAGKRKHRELLPHIPVLPPHMLVPRHSIGTVVASEHPHQCDRLYSMNTTHEPTHLTSKHEEMLHAYSPAPAYVNQAFESTPKPRERIYSFASDRMGPVQFPAGSTHYGQSTPSHDSQVESHGMAHVTSVNRQSEDNHTHLSPKDVAASRRASIAMTNV
ncbi:hypothetical protein RvY_17439 [Ramazzottius varieornatus]|uniref:Uncharacterized protein n=1 Tax=Ramazzottius varieornatus TaxID=947166 RepID=A0A1D1W7Z5_RAMVA|nr:hypothetical protein RvY_17439 [Ramazzottius varieornatus]